LFTSTGANGGSLPISDTGIVDTVFSAQLGGNAMLTVGADTEAISAVFLDSGVAFDQIGVRVANSFTYAFQEASSWTGSIAVPIDVNQLNAGTYLSYVVQGPDFASGALGAVEINIQSVPEPTAFLYGGLMSTLAGCVYRVRRMRSV
jgi:hypothetical protein